MTTLYYHPSPEKSARIEEKIYLNNVFFCIRKLKIFCKKCFKNATRLQPLKRLIHVIELKNPSMKSSDEIEMTHVGGSSGSDNQCFWNGYIAVLNLNEVRYIILI